ncbi:MAG: threonine synthase [Promethearchaeota archaeon]
MKDKYLLICLDCKTNFSSNEKITNCTACGGQLEVNLDYNLLKEKFESVDKLVEISNKRPRSIWNFLDFLPVLDKNSIISIGEGCTPLVKSKHLHDALGVASAELYFKIETVNPTGSFKDRQVSVGITKAMEWKKKGVITISSGNVGAAVSAYAARAGIPAIIIIPQMSSSSKILQIQFHGANIYRVRSNSVKEILEVITPFIEKHGYLNLMTASPMNPYINQGAKTIAIEIFIDTVLNPHVEFPDVVICPVGGGGLLASVYQGFLDLEKIGLLENIPRIIGVQPAGCAPLAKAILDGAAIERVFSNPWQNINTIATALADDVPLDARLAIPAIRKSNGTACIVDDEQIIDSMKLLANKEGIFAEPSGAITLAAASDLLKNGEIDKSERICLLITGSGFKDIDTCKNIVGPIPECVPMDHDWDRVFQHDK